MEFQGYWGVECIMLRWGQCDTHKMDTLGQPESQEFRKPITLGV